MEKFTTLKAIAAPLMLQNVDTDMMVPKQFLKTIKRTGLGKNLFDELRYNTDGSEKPEFVLNQPPFRAAKILLAGDNFGCGSSREHAPWALADFGIRCVIAPSFADIFQNNCIKNGIVPAQLPMDQIQQLANHQELTVDLEEQTIRGGNHVFKFEIDAFNKHCLLNGLDEIALTEQKAKDITDYEQRGAAQTPWLYEARRG